MSSTSTNPEKPLLVIFSHNNEIITSIKEAWGDDLHFTEIKNNGGLSNFFQTNQHSNVSFIIDTESTASQEIAIRIKKKFLNSKRIATGSKITDEETFLISEDENNLFNIAKSHSRITDFVKEIKIVESLKKTSS